MKVDVILGARDFFGSTQHWPRGPTARPVILSEAKDPQFGPRRTKADSSLRSEWQTFWRAGGMLEAVLGRTNRECLWKQTM